MLRPVDGSHESAQPKYQAGEQGSRICPLEVPAKPVAEQCRLKMNQDRVPMQKPNLDLSVVEWRQKKEPVQRIGDTRLRLRQHRLSTPQIRIPKRNPRLMPVSSLLLKPREDLIRQ